MAEVFISYSQKGRALIAPFAARLAELGVEAWFDREISAGESFGAVIRARLKEAKAILVCWSPEAIESKWVEAEAEYAREVGSYLPVYITPCALLPPFNTIHADDLSNWKGEGNDPAWIRLVSRIAKLINREGVAAAARVLAGGDEQARYDFARRFPDEPAAAKIWGAAEASHREKFRQRMLEARNAVEEKINAERASLEARLKAAAPAFDLWLADEQHATAQGPPPDPLDVIKQAQPSEDPRLREEIATLQSALTRSKAKENQLDAAKAEIARLSGDLAALKAKEGLEPAQFEDHQRLRDEIARLGDGLTKAKSRDADLDAAKAEGEKLSVELSAARTARSRAYALGALIGLIAVVAVVQAEVQATAKAKAVADLAELRDVSDRLLAQVQTLNSAADASAHNSFVAGEKQTETQARANSLAKQLQDATKELQDAHSYSSNLESQLAAVAVRHGTQSPPDADKQSWFVVVGSDPILSLSRHSAEALLEDFGKHCQNYKEVSQIINADDFGLKPGPWTVALGPYRAKADVDKTLYEVRHTCNFYAEPYTR